MTPEERERWERIDRHMEAAARNHEQLSADLAALKEIVDQHTIQIDKNSVQIERHSALLAEQAARFDTRMEQQRTEIAKEHRELGAFVTQLARIAQHTLERLDAVIVVLERHLANGQA